MNPTSVVLADMILNYHGHIKMNVHLFQEIIQPSSSKKKIKLYICDLFLNIILRPNKWVLGWKVLTEGLIGLLREFADTKLQNNTSDII